MVRKYSLHGEEVLIVKLLKFGSHDCDDCVSVILHSAVEIAGLMLQILCVVF